MPKRAAHFPSEGNVIYANFGKKRGPQASSRVTTKEDDVRYRYRNEAIRFLREAISSRTDSGRLNRGREYARNGHVINLEIGKGRVDAQVAGTQLQPFSTTIIFPHRDPHDIEEFYRYIFDNPNAISDLKKGNISRRIREMLIAEEPDELKIICDCPDHHEVCKHSVAVVEALIDRWESSPIDILALRSISISQINDWLLSQSEKQNKEISSGDQLKNFWENGSFPELPEPEKRIAFYDSDVDLLHQAMRLISYTTIDQLAAVSDIEDLYVYLTNSEE